jgi:hypothetical protein
VKQVGAAGAAALSSGALAAQPAPAPPQFAETPRSVHPTLNRRARGWLRFLWEKATTPDDWSADGVPHMWWDRYSNPVVTSYGRFDLHNSSYALLLMADETPAWREVYTRIADGLASRYPTYWGAIDWLTQIGDDPRRANYPPHVMQMIPERLRGNYNRIGWTANGIEPWGLSPDPIGSEGNLFFRGWFNLLLGIYRYVSGDDKYERPFEVTGYGDQVFEWDQHRIAELLERQYRERPEGPQCENTKIWFPCNAAAGLGMYLYDRIHGRATHRPVEGWLEYARENFLGIGDDGRLEWVTSYYDPIVNHKANGGPGAGVGTAFLLLPQDRELATLIYESAANALGWNDPRVEIRASQPGLVMARELGDHTALARLRAAAEREYDPRFFGDDNEMFGWWFGLNDGFPRGQLSAQMMLAEVGEGDAWGRALEAPHLDKYAAPTVEGVDFPSIGLYQAWNDTDGGALNVGTYAAAPDRRGMETSWRVTNLPNPDDVYILCDGQPFSRFAVDGPDSIRIDGDIDQRHYQIFTGYRGESAEQADARRRLQRQAGASASAAGAALAARGSAGEGGADGRGDARVQEASTSLASGDGPTCACCVA